jgi:hypothetical protein
VWGITIYRVAHQQQPVINLVMRGLVGHTDEVLAEALASLKHLR